MLTISWWRRTWNEHARQRRQRQRRHRRDQITPYLSATWLEERQVLSGAPPVLLEPIAPADPPAPIDAGPDANDNTPDLWEARVVSDGGEEKLLITVNGRTVHDGPLGSASGLTILGSADQDLLIVHGSTAHPDAWDGLIFQAGGGEDRLELQGVAVESVLHSLAAPGEGSVFFGSDDKGSAIVYQAVESIGDGLASQTRSFRFLNDHGRIVLADEGQPADGSSQLSWGTHTALAFSAPGKLLELEATAYAGAQIELNGLDGQFDADLHVTGSAGSRVSLGDEIRLGAGDLAIEAGEIEASGTVITSGAVIDLDAATAIHLTGDAAFQNDGGTVRLAAQDIQHGGSIVARGGEVELAAKGELTFSGVVDVSDTNSGGHGGSVRLFAEEIQLAGTARIDASGDAGGGSVWIGASPAGADPPISNALNTRVVSGARISAHAISSGDGGAVVLWADQTLAFHGEIQVHGGSLAGTGGSIEATGKQTLAFRGSVQYAAPASTGNGGTLQLTSYQLPIGPAPTGIDPAAINAALRSGASVILQADHDILIDQPLNGQGGVAGGSLELRAGDTVHIRAGITTQDGEIQIVAGPDPNDDILMTAGTAVRSGTADITMTAGRSLRLSSVSSQATVTLNTSSTADGAGIFAAADNASAEITAESLIVQAAGAFGRSTAPGAIDVDASTISLSGIAGGIYLDLVGTGDVTVSAVTSDSGTIQIRSEGRNLVLDGVATHNGSIIVLAEGQNLVASDVDSSHTDTSFNVVWLFAAVIEVGRIHSGESGSMIISAEQRILDGDGDSRLSGNTILLAADHRIGEIEDFVAAAGAPIGIVSARRVIATVDEAGAEVFLRHREGTFAPGQLEIRLEGHASTGLVWVNGDLDVSGGVGGLFQYTAGDSIGLKADQRLILPVAGINVGTGNLLLHGGVDVLGPAASRDLGRLTAHELSFVSGAAGGDTQLNTAVSGLTAHVAANDLFIEETNGLTALDLNAGMGTVTLRLNEGSVADSDPQVDIVAGTAVIILSDANNSGDNFGSANNPIGTSVGSLSVHTAAGTVHGSQWIQEQDGLTGLQLNAGRGNVHLTLTSGAVTDDRADDDPDIIATEAVIRLPGDFGRDGQAIGTSVDSLSIDTSAGTGSQWIREQDGLTRLQLNAGRGNIELILAAGAVTDDGADDDPDIIATAAVIRLPGDFGRVGQAIGTSVDSLSVDTSAGNGSQWIYEEDGLAGLQLNAGRGNVHLTLGSGAVTDDRADDDPDIIATAAVIQLPGNFGKAGNAIGTSVDSLSVDTSAGNGSQWIYEQDGLTGLQLNAGSGNVELTVGNGAVIDDRADDDPDIIATAAVIQLPGDFGSEDQAISTSVDRLWVDTSVGNGSQWIHEEDGLTGLQLNAGRGDVELILTAGAVTDDRADDDPDIIATAAVIRLPGDFGGDGQAIGTSVDSLSVDTSAGNGSQWIREEDGLTGLQLNAGSGNVRLTLKNGAATDDRADDDPDIIATAAVIQLPGDFGSADQAIGTSVDRLSVDTSAGNGSQWIREEDGLTGLQLNAGRGNIELILTAGAVSDDRAEDDPDIIATAAVILLPGDFGLDGQAIGTSVDSLSIDTSAGNGSQWIREQDGLTGLQLNAGSGNVRLTLKNGAVTDDRADDDADIIATEAVIQLPGDFGSEDQAIGTSVDRLSVDTSAGNGSQWIREEDGLAGLQLNAGRGNIELILAAGAVTDDRADDDPDIIATAAVIRLPGDFGRDGQAIGTSVDSLSVDTSAGNGSQWIYEADGLAGLQLNAGRGNVSLILTQGAVADADGDVDVTATAAVIQLPGTFGAVGNAIGTSVDRLSVDTSAGNGSQWIREEDGLTALALNAGSGNVTLIVADGAVTDADGDLDIIAGTAVVRLLDNDDSGDNFGSKRNPIGTSVDSLTVDTSGGHGNQWIREEDDLHWLDLDAGSGDVTLKAGGAILDSDDQVDVRAGRVTLKAATRVGEISIDDAGVEDAFLASDRTAVQGNPIQLAVQAIRLISTSEAGSQIHVAQQGDLTIGGCRGVIAAGGADQGWTIVRVDGDLDAGQSASSELAGDDSLALISTGTLTVPDAGFTTTGHLRMIGAANVVAVSGGELRFEAETLFLYSGGGGEVGGDAEVSSQVKIITAEMLTHDLIIQETGNLEIRSIRVHNGSVWIHTTGSINDADDDHAVDIQASGTIELYAGKEIGGNPTSGRAVDTAGRLELAAGSILIARSEGEGDIVLHGAGNLTLQDVTVTHGHLDVTTAAGDVMVGRITAGSTVTIRAAGGSIRDAADDSAVDITAGGLISLSARAAIGGADAGDPYLELAAGSRVHAEAKSGDIWLRGAGNLSLILLAADERSVDVVAAGNVEVGSITAGEAVRIQATVGSILDSENDSLVDITAGAEITLNAAASIGGAGPNDLYLDLAAGSRVSAESTGLGTIMLRGLGSLTLNRLQTVQGTIDVTADGQLHAIEVRSLSGADQDDILLRTTAGDILVTQVHAGQAGDVLLEAAEGIVAAGDSGPAIVAHQLQLKAASGVATSPLAQTDRWLQIDVNTVAAETNSGDINLLNVAGDLTIGSVAVGGGPATEGILVAAATATDGIHVIARRAADSDTGGALTIDRPVRLLGSDLAGIGDLVLLAEGVLYVQADLTICNRTDSNSPGDTFLNNMRERGKILGTGEQVFLTRGTAVSTSRGADPHRAVGQISTLEPKLTLPQTVFLKQAPGGLLAAFTDIQLADKLGLNYRLEVDWILGNDPQRTYLADGDELAWYPQWPPGAAAASPLNANTPYAMNHVYQITDFRNRPDGKGSAASVEVPFVFSFDLRPADGGFDDGIQFVQSQGGESVKIVVRRIVEIQPAAVGLRLPLPEPEVPVRLDLRPPEMRPLMESRSAPVSPPELITPLSTVAVSPRDHLELRRVTAGGEEVLVRRWADGDSSPLDDLPGLFSRLGNDRYRLYLVGESEELPLHPDVLIRQGVPMPVRGHYQPEGIGAPEAVPSAPPFQPAEAGEVGEAGAPAATVPEPAASDLPAPSRGQDGSDNAPAGGESPPHTAVDAPGSEQIVSRAVVGSALLLASTQGRWEDRVAGALKQFGGRSLGRVSRFYRRGAQPRKAK